MTTETQEETMTDAKGAQPEQLVALLDELDHARTNGEAADIHERIGLWAEEHGRALATALSECRERERVLREALGAIASLSFFAEANTFDRDEVLAIVDAALSADTQQREP